jgi:hypothetical protein
MPQIWMTYREIADLLGCDPDEARAHAIHRSLDRKKSRDGLTRVKLDLEWAGRFVAAIREDDLVLDQAVHDLRMAAGKMARNGGQFVARKAIAHQPEFIAKSG